MSLTTLDSKSASPVNSHSPKPSADLTVAQFIVEQLKEWGVKRIYGVVGDTILYLLDELSKQTSITYVPCAHEEGAALMASAEAKLTGRVSVCIATSGPGFINLLNGIADASTDRAPVLVITGQVDQAKIGTNTKQYINQQSMMGTLTDRTELLAHPDALPKLLQASLVESSLQGKVTHLSIPKDLFQQKVKGTVTPYAAYLHQPLATPIDAIQKAIPLLKQSIKPVILVGNGASQAKEQLAQLAEKLGSAIITTMPARNVVDNNHEWYVGGLGQAGSEASSIILAESDLIIILGATWWPEEYVPNQARIIQVDKAAGQIGGGHTVAHGIVGDIKQVVSEWLKLLEGEKRAQESWKQRIANAKREWTNQLHNECQADPKQSPIPPAAILNAIGEIAAENAIYTLDTGDHTLWFNRIVQVKQGQEILISGRWRTLGFALPAAIAAQLEYPERQVLAVAGDGGVVQTLMEFHTACLFKLPIRVLILENGSYMMEKSRMLKANLNPSSSELANPDFAAIATACGGLGLRASSLSELKPALQQAIAHPGPALISISTAEKSPGH